MTKQRALISRITEEEKSEIDKFCRKNHITISQFMREIINKRDKEKIRIISDKEKEILYNCNYEIKKIGSNINQIAYYFNLEHLKALDKKDRSFDDLIILDKIQKEQFEAIKGELNLIQKLLKNNENILNGIYENK